MFLHLAHVGCAAPCADGVCKVADQVFRGVSKSLHESKQGSPATIIEGPGSAWAFVLSGVDSAM